jgi:hypothetical protein
MPALPRPEERPAVLDIRIEAGRHLTFYSRMILSENRCPLFGIMR